MGALLSLNSQITKEASVWGMNLLMKNSFKLLEARRGSVPAKGCLFPILEPFFSFGRGHYARIFQGIGRRRT